MISLGEISIFITSPAGAVAIFVARFSPCPLVIHRPFGEVTHLARQRDALLRGVEEVSKEDWSCRWCLEDFLSG